MRLVLIADTFPPMKTSGSVQLRDLSIEFVKRGYDLTVLLPSSEISLPWVIEDYFGAQVLRLKSPKTKDVNYFRRVVNEFITPFMMYNNLKKSPIGDIAFDGVIWYSPSIFLAPLASILKKKNRIKSYLIIRDIFPNWAVDMELIPKYSFSNLFLTLVAKYQYSIADFIGVQAEGNLIYFDRYLYKSGTQIQVLNNWLGSDFFSRCKIRISETVFSNRKVFVYAGNMGIAQGLDIFFDLAYYFQNRNDLGFLFVGRGSEVCKLKKNVNDRQIKNVLFFDEIHPDEIGDLYSQCTAGIISLDPRHRSHNIPGKFLTYIKHGLPVLAKVNKGNDLSKLIKTEEIGQVSESNDLDELIQLTHILIDSIESDPDLPKRCLSVFNRNFKVKNASQQIINSLF